MALGRSKADKAIRALSKQKKGLMDRRERFTKRLLDTLVAHKKLERLITEFEKLRRDCYARAKDFLAKDEKDRARQFVARGKNFDSRIARAQEVGEMVEMMKGQVWDLDIAIREIGVDIEFVRATGEIEEQALFELGTRASEAEREAIEQTERLADTIRTVREMETEGLTIKTRPDTSYPEDPDVEKELERLSREVEAERVGEKIAEMETEFKDLKEEE